MVTQRSRNPTERLRKIARRSVTVPAVLGSTTALALTLPLWLPALAVVDLFRRKRFASLRTGVLLMLLVGYESLGVLAATGLWLRHKLGGSDEESFLEENFQLQCWWVQRHLANMRRVFGIRIDIEAEPDFGRGPVLVLMRHASIADTLLGALLFSLPHGVRLRYVLKRELLFGPCLDIVGHRLPNVFVSRDGQDTTAAIGAVARLTEELGPRDGVIIYPEGTRFTPEKRSRILARLRERGDMAELARAEKLENLLPPRPGGTLALLETAPEIDVAVVAHVGFEGVARLSDLWSGRIIDARVQVQGRRIPAGEIPADRREWLLTQWEQLDAWISQHGDART
jgi:1-acyl-sn-glycerol-3-phosphate acyltransferase